MKSVDVVQTPGERYAASTKAVVRIKLKKAQGEGFSFVEKAKRRECDTIIIKRI